MNWVPMHRMLHGQDKPHANALHVHALIPRSQMKDHTCSGRVLAPQSFSLSSKWISRTAASRTTCTCSPSASSPLSLHALKNFPTQR